MRAIRILALAFAALTLANCQYVESETPPPLNFNRYQPIILDVGEIDIIDEYKSPMRDPYVEHRLPYSPADAMRIWVKDRLRASGNEKTLQVIIKDASVVAKPLEKSSGVMGAIGLAQDVRYDLSLAVEMRIYGRDSAMSTNSLQASTTRFIAISDSVSSHEREVKFRQMVADSMEVLNAELEKNIFTYFGNNITYQ